MYRKKAGTYPDVSTGSGRQQGLVDLFQKHDNLGSLVLLPGIGGYQQTIVYVGAYTRLTAFPFPAGSDAPIAAVSPDCAGDEGKTLRIGDHECTVTVVPSDMDVYHPLHYSPPASENLKKTIRLPGERNGAAEPQSGQFPAQGEHRLGGREVESQGHAAPKHTETPAVQLPHDGTQCIVALAVVASMSGKCRRMFPRSIHSVRPLRAGMMLQVTLLV